MNYPVSRVGIFRHLVGLGPWLDAAAAVPAPHTFGDREIDRMIPGRIRLFERLSNLSILPYQVCTDPDGTYPGTADTPLLTPSEDAYDYYLKDSEQYFRLRLKRHPVREVQRVRIVVGNQLVLGIPADWFAIKKQSGEFWIQPSYGPLLVNASVNAFAQLRVGFGPYDYIPNAVQVDYICGMPDNWWLDPYSVDPGGDPDWEQAINPQHADLVEKLEEFCALGVLNRIAQLADAGLAQVSMGGGVGSESYSYTRFTDRKDELDKATAAFMELSREQDTAILLGGV